MLTPEQEREAFYEKECMNGIYAHDGLSYYDIEKSVTDYWLARIAARESALREELAKEVEKLADFDYTDGNTPQVKLKNHKELGYKLAVKDAARAIRGDKK